MPLVLLLWYESDSSASRATRLHLQGGARSNYPAEWLLKADISSMEASHCSILFWHGGYDRLCSCADKIIHDIEHHEVDHIATVYADSDWRIIQDPKMDVSNGLEG